MKYTSKYNEKSFKQKIDKVIVKQTELPPTALSCFEPFLKITLFNYLYLFMWKPFLQYKNDFMPL